MDTVARKATNVTFGDFADAEQFLRWVATYHGANVSETCRDLIEKAVAEGRSVDVMSDILVPMTKATRQVDVAKNRFRARFCW